MIWCRNGLNIGLAPVFSGLCFVFFSVKIVCPVAIFLVCFFFFWCIFVFFVRVWSLAAQIWHFGSSSLALWGHLGGSKSGTWGRTCGLRFGSKNWKFWIKKSIFWGKHLYTEGFGKPLFFLNFWHFFVYGGPIFVSLGALFGLGFGQFLSHFCQFSVSFLAIFCLISGNFLSHFCHCLSIFGTCALQFCHFLFHFWHLCLSVLSIFCISFGTCEFQFL